MAARAMKYRMSWALTSDKSKVKRSRRSQGAESGRRRKPRVPCPGRRGVCTGDAMGSGTARQTTGSNQNMDVAAVVGRDQELDEHPHHAVAGGLARDVLYFAPSSASTRGLTRGQQGQPDQGVLWWCGRPTRHHTRMCPRGAGCDGWDWSNRERQQSTDPR